MANFIPTVRPVATLESAGSPLIHNVTVLANTETSVTLATGAKQFLIKPRTPSVVKVAFISGNSGTLYITIPRNASLVQSDILFPGTIYFQADIAGVIEILEWS